MYLSSHQCLQLTLMKFQYWPIIAGAAGGGSWGEWWEKLFAILSEGKMLLLSLESCKRFLGKCSDFLTNCQNSLRWL